MTAFGDVFVETAEGPVLVVDSLELRIEEVASSQAELEARFADPDWARTRLLVDLALLAAERGLARRADQVFAAAPHPALTGELVVERLVVMSLPMWHSIRTSIRGGAAP